MKSGFGLRGLSRWLEGGRQDVPAFVPPASVYTAPQELTPAPPEAPVREAPAQIRRDALMGAFNPAHPVQRRRDLAGRDDKLAALFEAMLNERKHAIVHGARGSGKTSLVHVFGDYADQRNAIVIYMACEEDASFGEIVRHFARFVPTDGLPAAEAAAFAHGLAGLDEASRPRAFVELFSLLGQHQVIFILDEFDRVTDAKAQSEIATFMKLLSDAHVPVQLLIVGIARSVSDIIDCHPSLRRHLVAIAVGRIAREDVALLVDQGAARAGLRFDPAARDLIVRTSCGSPYHARLFAHAAGLAALDRGTDGVDAFAALAGMEAATGQWAQLNEADSQLFRTLAGQPQPLRRRLADIARVAAIGDGFTQGSVIDDRGGNAQMEGALDGALVSDVRDISRRIFRDSLAPQFLLATIEMAEAEEQLRHAPPPPSPASPPAPARTAPGISWEAPAPPHAALPASLQPPSLHWQPAAPTQSPAPAPSGLHWQPGEPPQTWAPPAPTPPAAHWSTPAQEPVRRQGASWLAGSTPPPAAPPWPAVPGWQATETAPPRPDPDPPTYPTEPYKAYVPPAAGSWSPPPRNWNDRRR